MQISALNPTGLQWIKWNIVEANQQRTQDSSGAMSAGRDVCAAFRCLCPNHWVTTRSRGLEPYQSAGIRADAGTAPLTIMCCVWTTPACSTVCCDPFSYLLSVCVGVFICGWVSLSLCELVLPVYFPKNVLLHLKMCLYFQMKYVL